MPAFDQSNYGGHNDNRRSGYYRNSNWGNGGRPDSFVDNYMQSNQQSGHNQSPRAPRHPRWNSEGMASHHPPGTPGMDMPSSPEPMSPAAYGGHKASYDNMSGSEGQAPYSTNPTTANSSFENFPGKPGNGHHGPQASAETYGMTGFGSNGFHPGPINKPTPAEPRQIIKLGSNGDSYTPAADPISSASPSSPGKKRRSWLSRRFSKSG